MQRDPNRYAEGLEALALRARIEDEELTLDVIRTKYERAQQAHAETEAQFRAIEQQYNLYKGLLEDSSTYLGKAKSQLDFQTASVARERVLFHPIRKTPLDILACIFELCIDEVDCHTPLPVESVYVRKRQQQPYRLAAVCRRWRQASLAHPRAWSHVEWSFDLVKPTNTDAWSDYLTTHLSRARSAPLTACLTRLRESKPHHEELAGRIAGVVRICVRAQIKISHLNTGDPLLALVTTATPKLSGINIQFPSPKSEAVLQNTQVLPKAPALKYIYARNAFRGGPIAFPLLETARIYDIECTDETDALGVVLRSLPRLANLSLYMPFVDYERATQTRQVVAQVQELFLHVEDDCPVEQLSSRFEFTAVTDLTLYGDPPSTDQRLRFLRALGEKSPIEELIISDIGDPWFAVFLHILPSLGRLQVLRMECTDFTNDNLLALQGALCSKDRLMPWPCMHLSGIQFRNSCKFAEDCDPGILTDLIHSRASAARDNALDQEIRPSALTMFLVEGWRSSSSEASIQDRIDRALKAGT